VPRNTRMGSRTTSKNKTNVTIAMDNQILNKLRAEADDKNQSVNTRINEILTKYTQFYKRCDELKCVAIPAQIYKLMLDNMNEQIGIGWLKKAVHEIWPSVMIHDNIPTDIENFVEHSFVITAKSAGLFSMFKKHYDEKGFLCLVFEHEYGIKWSRMISEVFAESLIDLFKVKVERSVLPSTVLIRVLEKNLEKIYMRL
jgi:hypothetical protein